MAWHEILILVLVFIGTGAAVFNAGRGFYKDSKHVKVVITNSTGCQEDIYYTTYAIKIINNSYLTIQLDQIIGMTTEGKYINFSPQPLGIPILPQTSHTFTLDTEYDLSILKSCDGQKLHSITVQDSTGNSYGGLVGKNLAAISFAKE